MPPTTSLSLDELLREIRARAHQGDERTIVLYGRPVEANRGFTTAQMIADVRELQGQLYAVDSRRDLYEAGEVEGLEQAAAAVAMLVEAADLRSADSGTWVLGTGQFGAAYQLCPSERFHAQPCGGFCSGVLVGRRLVATAAHCIRGLRPEDRAARLAQVRVVFGFRMTDAAAAVTTFAAARVYTPVRLVDHVLKPADGADWALLELDRDVEGIAPRPVRTAARIADDAKVSVIGHPCGLPAKYAPGATVRLNDNAAFFRADLDAFGGNSGSPVFSADWTVEGLLARGAPDFVRDGACMKSLVMPVRDDTDDPPGEDCVRATLFAGKLPEA